MLPSAPSSFALLLTATLAVKNVFSFPVDGPSPAVAVANPDDAATTTDDFIDIVIAVPCTTTTTTASALPETTTTSISSLNEPCGGNMKNAAQCEDGLVCLHTSALPDSPGTCQIRESGLGESCGGSTRYPAECASGLVCVYSNSGLIGQQGVCQTAATETEAVVTRRPIVISDVGGPCGGFVMNPPRCKEGLVCIRAKIPDLPGVCANPGIGGAETSAAPAPSATETVVGTQFVGTEVVVQTTTASPPKESPVQNIPSEATSEVAPSPIVEHTTEALPSPAQPSNSPIPTEETIAPVTEVATSTAEFHDGGVPHTRTLLPITEIGGGNSGPKPTSSTEEVSPQSTEQNVATSPSAQATQAVTEPSTERATQITPATEPSIEFSDVGGVCGGFVAFPHQCKPGLVCVKKSLIADFPGVCQYPSTVTEAAETIATSPARETQVSSTEQVTQVNPATEPSVVYSDVGGTCGGFVAFPHQCKPGLVCVKKSLIADFPGVCEYPSTVTEPVATITEPAVPPGSLGTQCGGFVGLPCNEGLICVTPTDIADGMGVCRYPSTATISQATETAVVASPSETAEPSPKPTESEVVAPTAQATEPAQSPSPVAPSSPFVETQTATEPVIAITKVLTFNPGNGQTQTEAGVGQAGTFTQVVVKPTSTVPQATEVVTSEAAAPQVTESLSIAVTETVSPVQIKTTEVESSPSPIVSATEASTPSETLAATEQHVATSKAAVPTQNVATTTEEIVATVESPLPSPASTIVTEPVIATVPVSFIVGGGQTQTEENPNQWIPTSAAPSPSKTNEVGQTTEIVAASPSPAAIETTEVVPLSPSPAETTEAVPASPSPVVIKTTEAVASPSPIVSATEVTPSETLAATEQHVATTKAAVPATTTEEIIPTAESPVPSQASVVATEPVIASVPASFVHGGGHTQTEANPNQIPTSAAQATKSPVAETTEVAQPSPSNAQTTEAPSAAETTEFTEIESPSPVRVSPTPTSAQAPTAQAETTEVPVVIQTTVKQQSPSPAVETTVVVPVAPSPSPSPVAVVPSPTQTSPSNNGPVTVYVTVTTTTTLIQYVTVYLPAPPAPTP